MSCEIVKELDEYAWKEEFFITCKQHSTSWVKWRLGDPPFVCTEELNHGTTNNMPAKDD